MKFVYVEWVDSASTGSWRPLDELYTGLDLVKSVGWIVAETDDVIVIASHFAAEAEDAKPQICGYMKIPKVAIKRTVKLSEPK